MINIRTYKHPKKQDQPPKHSLQVLNNKGQCVAEHVQLNDDTLYTLLKHYDKYSNCIYHCNVTLVRELTFREGLRM